MTFIVTVRFPTITPMIHEEKFIFANGDEADRFCDKAAARGWDASLPMPFSYEIHTCDTAMSWVFDEIEACKQVCW